MNDKKTNNVLVGALTEDFLDDLDLRFDVFVNGVAALPMMVMECIKHIASSRPELIGADSFGETEIKHFLTNHFQL